MSPRAAQRKRRSPVAGVIGSIVGGLVALAVAVFLGYQAFSGGPLFAGTGSTYTTEIDYAKSAVAESGRVPFSADQWVLLLPTILALGVVGLIIVLRLPKGSARVLPAYGSVVLALLALTSLIVLVVAIVWAATGHPFSNFIPKGVQYPRSYVFPIAICAVAAVVCTAALVGWRRIGRR